MIVSNRLPQLMRGLRKDKALTFAALARCSGVPEEEIRLIESGCRVAPSQNLLEKLARALHADQNTLLRAARQDARSRLAKLTSCGTITAEFTRIHRYVRAC